jgi:hypothetical protein
LNICIDTQFAAIRSSMSSGYALSAHAKEILLFKFRVSTTGGALSEVSGSEGSELSEESELEITCTQMSASQSQELLQYL